MDNKNKVNLGSVQAYINGHRAIQLNTQFPISLYDNDGVFTLSVSNATISANGLMSSSDKSKLDGIANNANNYSLPDATTTTKGGVIVGTNISISNGTISVDNSTTSGKGVVQLSSATNSTSESLAATTKAVKTVNDSLSTHTSDTNNPHSVTKSQIGLGNVDNKSSATIRGEITSGNVTSALGYTPIDKAVGTAKGDIIYYSASDTPARLGAGTNGHFLKLVDGVPTWAADNNTTYSLATQSANGLMSATDFKKINPQEIPANANLNDYTGVGLYRCDKNNTAATLVNSPTSNAFTMVVLQHAGTYQFIQEYMTSNAKAWHRNRYSSEWGNWVEHKWTDTNTWRGVQNNLTSTATDQSLSAAQGKALNEAKLNRAGDTMTGNLTFSAKNSTTGIYFNGTNASYRMITFLDNVNDTYGNGIVIGGGGSTVIGGGEAAQTVVADTTNYPTNSGQETLILANDQDIIFLSNAQSGTSPAKKMVFNSAGNLLLPANPTVALGAATKQYVDNGLSGKAASSHNHAASDITSGTLAVARGGTGNATGYIQIGAMSGTTPASMATCEGYYTTASKIYAHAEGYYTTASGAGAHAEGQNTIASGESSHAEGYRTTASGKYSHAEGHGTTASGAYSHAGGDYTLASAEAQTAIGKYNAENTTNTNAWFIVGKGTSTTARANAFRIGSTASWAAGTMNGSGADYAELFEWEDHNVNNEDRRGLFVTIVGDKIRLATNTDSFILGIISGNPTVLGDVYDDQWQGMYECDIFGSPVYEDVEIPDEIIKETDADGNEIERVVIPAHIEHRQKLNPGYDSSKKYIPRSERPEWSAVGMIGKLVAIDDGSCVIDKYCRPSIGGIATFSETETKYRVMKRIDKTHIQVLIIP